MIRFYKKALIRIINRHHISLLFIIFKEYYSKKTLVSKKNAYICSVIQPSRLTGSGVGNHSIPVDYRFALDDRHSKKDAETAFVCGYRI